MSPFDPKLPMFAVANSVTTYFIYVLCEPKKRKNLRLKLIFLSVTGVFKVLAKIG